MIFLLIVYYSVIDLLDSVDATNNTILSFGGVDVQGYDIDYFITDPRNKHHKREASKGLTWKFPIKWHKVTCYHKEAREYRWSNEYHNPESHNLTITVGVKDFKGLSHDIDVKKVFNGVMLDHCFCYGPKNHGLESFCSCNMFCVCMKDMTEYQGCHGKISFKGEYQFVNCSTWNRGSEVSCRKFATKVTRCEYKQPFVVG